MLHIGEQVKYIGDDSTLARAGVGVIENFTYDETVAIVQFEHMKAKVRQTNLVKVEPVTEEVVPVDEETITLTVEQFKEVILTAMSDLVDEANNINPLAPLAIIEHLPLIARSHQLIVNRAFGRECFEEATE